jgi:hypothetical protein
MTMERGREHLAPSGATMIIRSYLMTLWAVLFLSCGTTVAQTTRKAEASRPWL